MYDDRFGLTIPMNKIYFTSVLWNAVTNNCSALTKNIPYRDLRLKLKSQANFNEFSFKITSASTCNFRKDDFVYT